MSKTDLVFSVLKRFNSALSQVEKILLEVKLVTHFHGELSAIFRSRYQSYQQLIKSKETNMLSIQFMKEIINDILSTEEYSISGIANHTHIPEEILTDIASGINTNPTFDLSIKIFELHATVRRDLYDQVMRKIVSEYLVPIGMNSSLSA